jgi:cell division protein FtsX
MSRLFSRTLTIKQAARQREPALSADPNPHLEALARFAKIAGTVVAFVLVMAVIMVVDVAIWVPRVRP